MARAYFGTMEDIMKSSNHKNYRDSYYTIKKMLEDDLNIIKYQAKNIDAEILKKLSEPISNEKLFLKKCRKNYCKHRIINGIKTIILLFVDYK